eukprot:2848457-Rhodomonas_salina.1
MVAVDDRSAPRWVAAGSRSTAVGSRRAYERGGGCIPRESYGPTHLSRNILSQSVACAQTYKATAHLPQPARTRPPKSIAGGGSRLRSYWGGAESDLLESEW